MLYPLLRSLNAGFITLLLSIFSLSAQAVLLTYEQVSVSGNSYEYSYTLTNNDVAAGIDELTIYFEFGVYENLDVESSPAGWAIEPVVIAQPDSFLGDGFVDWLTLTAPLALGDSLGGFNVSFDLIGTAQPGQYFEVYDDSFTFLGSGTSTSVPEPGSMALLCLGLLALAGARVRKQG